MQTHLHGRDCITLQEFTKDELDTLLDVAFALKRARALGEPHAYLRDKVLAMLFFFSSTRTRTSFEAGMAQLGGHAQFIESKTTQIAHGDTAKEIGEILGRYNDGIAIRQCDWGTGNKYLRDVAEASRVPVLNMQCDIYHPHQALADIMTIIEHFGDPRGKTATVSWAAASSYSKPVSVAQSLVLLLPRFGMNLRLVHPPEFKLMPDIVEQGARERPQGACRLRDHQRLRRGLQRDRRGLCQELGRLVDDTGPRRGQGPHRQVLLVDDRRKAYGARQR